MIVGIKCRVIEIIIVIWLIGILIFLSGFINDLMVLVSCNGGVVVVRIVEVKIIKINWVRIMRVWLIFLLVIVIKF